MIECINEDSREGVAIHLSTITLVKQLLITRTCHPHASTRAGKRVAGWLVGCQRMNIKVDDKCVKLSFFKLCF